MGIKQDRAPRQIGSFPQTEHETAKSRHPVMGTAHDRMENGHRNNTTFVQSSIDNLKSRIKAVLGENPPAATCLTLCRMRTADKDKRLDP